MSCSEMVPHNRISDPSWQHVNQCMHVNLLKYVLHTYYAWKNRNHAILKLSLNGRDYDISRPFTCLCLVLISRFLKLRIKCFQMNGPDCHNGSLDMYSYTCISVPLVVLYSRVCLQTRKKHGAIMVWFNSFQSNSKVPILYCIWNFVNNTYNS